MKEPNTKEIECDYEPSGRLIIESSGGHRQAYIGTGEKGVHLTKKRLKKLKKMINSHIYYLEYLESLDVNTIRNTDSNLKASSNTGESISPEDLTIRCESLESDSLTVRYHEETKETSIKADLNSRFNNIVYLSKQDIAALRDKFNEILNAMEK